jgi:hypothetical protein
MGDSGIPDRTIDAVGVDAATASRGPAAKKDAAELCLGSRRLMWPQSILSLTTLLALVGFEVAPLRLALEWHTSDHIAFTLVAHAEVS